MSKIQPDSSFMKKLKALDKRLGCRFNRDSQRFVITFSRGYGRPLALFMVKDGEGAGTFRQPDDRDIEFLQKHDMEKTTLRERLNEVSKYMEDTRRKRKEEVSNEIRDRTKDDKIQLMSAMTRPTNPKAGRGYFPPVTLKQKGYTVIDRRRFSADVSEGDKDDNIIQPNE